MRRIVLVTVLSTTLVCFLSELSHTQPAPAGAREGRPDPSPPAERPVAGGYTKFLGRLGTSPTLLGDPAGTRATLERAGIFANLYYNHFLGVLAHGGLDPGPALRESGSGDLFVALDLERALRLRGSEALFQLKSQYGRNINPRVAAIGDPIDDADGDHAAVVPQLWLQQSLWGRRMQIRAGYLDQQIALDRNAYANSEDRQFMSTLLDNNGVIVPLPSALGATLFVDASDWLEVILSTADADVSSFRPGVDTAFDDFESLFGYVEIGVRPPTELGPRLLPGKYRFGLFWDPRQKPVFSRNADQTQFRTGDAGFYLSFDQLVYRERAASAEGLGLFARFGYRDPEVNVVERSWSLGLQYVGVLPGREADVLGAAMYTNRVSDDARHSGVTKGERETGCEVYYRADVLPWLAVSPDFQYIADPGGVGSVENAVIVALRVRVTFF